MRNSLIASIDAVKLSPFRFYGWLGKAPTEPIPNWLFPVRARAARFACLKPDNLVQGRLIRYDPGAGIVGHRHRPVFEHILGISQGWTLRSRFRRVGSLII
jgi:hypothetical protein